MEHWGPLAIYTSADDPGGHGYTYAEPQPAPVHHAHVWTGTEWKGVHFMVHDGQDWVPLL